jgi:putative SOS response-associated peptidase YedK
MCGRYELRAKARELNRQFPPLDLGPFEMPHGVEMQPAEPVLMITGNGTGYLGSKARWGLVGSFLDREPRNPPINLPAEGLVTKPFYSKILKRNRCLIPATAFYEWQSLAERRQKMRISHAKGKVLMFAGIFDHHPLAGTTCAILTSAADDTLSAIHDRMPLILDREQSSFWLGEHAEFPEEAFEVLLQTSSQHPLVIEAVIEEAPSPQLSLAFA